ncbi:hypothetical protein CYMTET_22009 [Cymbomonas tetramitiformis]|uniref:Protein kinase domain-containing protein n=1 Tax=Cymbomonas tetramitiformis TaxID=36881 RepID=A0AAE0L2M2_9CHLO|nr:hypothetical protein CYMTET_22009 [Cymbomonas tetramitiformis]
MSLQHSIASSQLSCRGSFTSHAKGLRDLKASQIRSVRAASKQLITKAAKIDISLGDIQQGKKIGSGNFGDVFEGRLSKGNTETPVILKGKKNVNPMGQARADRFFDAEAKICRRLRNCNGVASFIGVGGADVYLIWKYEGLATLADVLKSRDCLRNLGAEFGVSSEEAAVKATMKSLLTSISSLHGAGVVHRDIKPDNLLLSVEGGGGGWFSKRSGCQVKLIDLGGCADLRTGTNFNPEETIFDPVYGAPEQYIGAQGLMGGLFGRIGGLGGLAGNPALFDAYSAGLVLLQLTVPSMRSKAAIQGMRKKLEIIPNQDLDVWREKLGARADKDFALLDANGGKGWDLVKGLVRPRKNFKKYTGPERMSIKQALSHPFLR